MKPPGNALLTLLLILAMCAWGGSWTSGKLIAGAASPAVLTFWRFLATVVAFLPIVILRRKPLKIGGRALLQAVLGAICIVGYNRMFFRGLQTGLAGAGGVLVTTMNPILTSLFASLFFQRKLGARAIIGLILGLIGGLILLEIWAISPERLLQSGNAFFVVASICWALLTIISEKSKEHLPLLTFSFYVYGFSTVMDFFLTSPHDILLALDYHAIFWLNILYLAILATIFATTIYFLASSRLGSGRASSFIFTVPASAVLISWLVTDEIPKLVTIAGGLIGMGAVYLINSKTEERARIALTDGGS